MSRAGREPSDRGPPVVFEAGSGLDPFQVLTAEHALIRLQMTRALVAARDDPHSAAARRALGVLSVGISLHFLREDRVMYPAAERLFGGRDGAASVLRSDHGAIRDAFAQRAAKLAARGPASAEDLEILRHLIEAHFGKEERVLFPLMTAHLAGKESAELARRLRVTPVA